jgi:hypothetical protein
MADKAGITIGPCESRTKINIEELTTLPWCTACEHQRHPSLKHPAWMSCHCAEPVFEVIKPVEPPMTAEWYDC